MVEKAGHLPVDRAQRGTERGQDKIQSLRTYLQPPASPQLLKFLEPPQGSAAYGNQGSFLYKNWGWVVDFLSRP